MTQALMDGTALGWNPRKTARAALGAPGLSSGGMARGLGRIMTIARTEQLRVYREASRMQYQASGVVDGYKRISAKDDRVCMACLIADGTFYPLSEPLADHPNGRCALIPCVKGVGRPEWQTGQAWFLEQSEDQQRQTMGAAKYAAWRAGKFDLTSLVQATDDPVWGPSIGVTPLRGLV